MDEQSIILSCRSFLDENGIAYTMVEHDHAFTIEQCHEIEKTLGCPICKNLLLTNRQKTELYLLLMPGDKPFKTRLLSAQIGSARLSFAAPEQMQEHLNITPGSLSVLGLMNDADNAVRLLMDRELLENEYIGCHPCINCASMKLATADVINAFVPATHHDITYVELPWEIPEE